MALNFKKNKVRVNIFDYNLTILGLKGIGKTTLAFEVCEKLVPDQYVIFNAGREDGIKTLNGAIYYDVPEWSDFEDAVDEIVDEKASTYKDLKVIVVDTIDEIFAMCEREVVRLSNKAGKPCDSINGAFSGYGAGISKVVEMVTETLWKLKSVGISVFYIGHVREKSKVDPMSDLEYDTITSTLSNRYFDSIADKMDLIGVCFIDRSISKEKSGRKDIHGKLVEKNVVKDEARKICFRSSNYVAESKSRFPDISDVINLDADEFIEAIEDAIKKLIDKSGVPEKDLRKEQETERKKREAEIAAAEIERASKKELDSIIAQIKEYFVQKKDAKELESLKPIARVAKELGYDSPIAVDNIEDAKKILEMCV